MLSTSRVLWYLKYMCVRLCTCEFFGESIRFISAAVRAMPSSKCCLKGKRAAVYVTECLLFSAVRYCFHSIPVLRFLTCYSLHLALMKCTGWLKGLWSGQAHRHGAKEVGGGGSGWELNIHEERDQSTRRKSESEGIERKQICRNGTLWLLMPFIKLRCQADICRYLLSFLC